MKIIVQDTNKQRLDKYLCTELPELTRARIQSLLKSGDILLNGVMVKAKSPAMPGDIITVHIPDPAPENAQPENIPLNVLYEDDDLIVLNKSSGMVVHPASGNLTGTLVNALLYHCKGKLAELGGEERPGIVHRLDKDTSGCIVVAKTELTHKALVAQFAERSTKKKYLTVVQGVPNKLEDSIFTNIGRHPVNRLKMAVVNPGSGKSAITDYLVLGTLPENDTSLILCDLHTGRTHQIRVHMLHIGTPILADPIYANANKQKCHPGRLMLHALNLSITHPVTLERLHFTAPIPEEYEPWVNKFPSDL
ncbi:MAG: 23S rRNA pseudouridine1911/1915/1917 synthase [Rubritalea sp.]|jgi:23S rRNA pseudouridine1911/1915/1917 synthase